jgi:hypothetical protein
MRILQSGKRKSVGAVFPSLQREALLFFSQWLPPAMYSTEIGGASFKARVV